MTKKTKSFTILIILILMLFTIQACNNNSRRPIDYTIYRGTKGIEVSFLNNAPPKNIYEGEPTTVMIELWNRGAYPIENNENIIINLRYDPIYFSLSNQNKGTLLNRDNQGSLRNLQGLSETWPNGEKLGILLAELNTQKIIGTREAPTTNIEAVICYPYKTFLTEMICLDTDIYGVEQKPLCRHKEFYPQSNQGAPIAITKLEVNIIPKGFTEVEPTGHVPVLNDSGELIGLGQSTKTGRLILVEPVIRIYARNVALGDTFIKKEHLKNQFVDEYNLCTFRDDTFELRDHNKILLTKATLDGLNMSCSKDVLNLANPSDFITCRLNENQTGFIKYNIQVPVSIEFSYYYRDSATTQTKINRVW